MRYLRGLADAPLTLTWLLVLLVTTLVQRRAGHTASRRIQRNNSTNLRRLRTEPHRVLTTSLFWLDDARWWPYVPVFAGIVAPAERRLGSRRWLLVGLTAHIVGTYVGQSYLRLLIRTGRVPERLEDARDVGVSYFVLGVAGALTKSAKHPRRIQAAAVLALAANTAARPTFTEVGHLTAFLVGLAADPYPAELR
ncbi:rhomboid-like protein [Mycolicibacterium phlei]